MIRNNEEVHMLTIVAFTAIGAITLTFTVLTLREALLRKAAR